MITFSYYKLNILEIGNYKFVNGLPHSLKFDNGQSIEGNPDFAKKIKAESYFIANDNANDNANEIIFGNIKYRSSKETEELIGKFKKEFPDIKIITSQITVNSINDNIFVSPITTKETERSPPNEKICYFNRWNSN